VIAYHGDPELKRQTLAQMREHVRTGELAQGWGYWFRGRGCSVGCLTHDPRGGGHDQYPVRWGIPVELAWLEDSFFERLPPDSSQEWPIAFLDAIEPGADLELVWPRFALTLLADPEHGGLRHTDNGSAQQIAVVRVADLFRQTIAGVPVPLEQWAEAEKAVREVERWWGLPVTEIAAEAARAAREATGAAAAARAAAAVRAAEMPMRAMLALRRTMAWQTTTLLRLLREAPMAAVTS
jgi:hypothetical protein